MFVCLFVSSQIVKIDNAVVESVVVALLYMYTIFCQLAYFNPFHASF